MSRWPLHHRCSGCDSSFSRRRQPIAHHGHSFTRWLGGGAPGCRGPLFRRPLLSTKEPRVGLLQKIIGCFCCGCLRRLRFCRPKPTVCSPRTARWNRERPQVPASHTNAATRVLTVHIQKRAPDGPADHDLGKTKTKSQLTGCWQVHARPAMIAAMIAHRAACTAAEHSALASAVMAPIVASSSGL